MRVCAIIPTYDNPRTLRGVVEEVRGFLDDVLVVDDGSSGEGARVAKGLRADGLCTLLVREQNGGKGAAVKSGLAWAREHGFDHALQIDADAQHDAAVIPAMLRAAQGSPRAFVLAQPTFDASAPRGRLLARQLSKFWAAVETMSLGVGDPLCGFRVYPVKLAEEVGARGNAMDFDPEILVRLVWAGAEVSHVPTRVRYIAEEDGGVSHYRGVTDTWLISLAHARLCIEGLGRALGRVLGRRP